MERAPPGQTLEEYEQAKDIVQEIKVYIRSRSLKYTSWQCKYEQYFQKTISQNKPVIITGALSLVITQLIKHKYTKYQQDKKLISELTSTVLLFLKKNKQKSMKGEVVYPYLSSVQLRDILTNDYHQSLYNKNKLWAKITHHLEKNNSTIKTELIEFNGEIMKVWEWVGPLDDFSVSLQ